MFRGTVRDCEGVLSCAIGGIASLRAFCCTAVRLVKLVIRRAKTATRHDYRKHRATSGAKQMTLPGSKFLGQIDSDLEQRSGLAMIAHRVRGDGDAEHDYVQSVKTNVLQIPPRLRDNGAGFPALHNAFSLLHSIAGHAMTVL